jgi:hypothetical protein
MTWNRIFESNKAAERESTGKRDGTRVAPRSRNAHDQNVLVRRAHSRIDQAPLENIMVNWEERAVKNSQPIPYGEVKGSVIERIRL